MNVGCFFCGNNREYVEDLLRVCSSRGIDALGYRFNRGWEGLDGSELHHHLHRFTHIVVSIHHEAIPSRWLSFLLGFAFGCDLPLYFVSPEMTKGEMRAVLPGYASHYPVIEDLEILGEELTREHDIDFSVQRIENAKAELTALGYPLTEAAMVSAVQEGVTAAVQWFVQTGFSPDTHNSTGVPVLNIAARQRHLGVLRVLLSAGADVNLVAKDRGTTALMEAAAQGDTEAVGLLTEREPDLDIQSASGQTALMMAIGEGQTEIAGLLLDSGARTDIVDALGMTAYKYASLFQHDRLLQRIGG